MKTSELQDLVNVFSIDDVERELVLNYIKNANIDHNQSPFLKNYLYGYTIKKELAQRVEALNHTSIEELVMDMGVLIPQQDAQTNGAFFTPSYIVDFIISTISPSDEAKVVDLSCGSGAFLLGAIKYYKRKGISVSECVKKNIYGMDILAYNVRRCKLVIALYALSNGEIIDETKINVLCGDSLKHEWEYKFDAVIGNPPYVKFQDLDEATRSYLYDNWYTTKFGTYNLYFAFFELGLKVLSSNGMLGYITPNNYFTSLSGECLRSYFQSNQSICKIVDFVSTRVFDVQTYTAITFLNKRRNESIQYDRIEKGERPQCFLKNLVFSYNEYSNLNEKKWRLLCGDEREIIKKIETIGTPIGDLFNICAGIATLKDDAYIISPYEEDERYYYIKRDGLSFKIEKELTRPLVKISEMKSQDDINNNNKRIVFPYIKRGIGKVVAIEEDIMAEKYPQCNQYLEYVRPLLENRGKGKHTYKPYYIYGRSQGLNRYGSRLLTPTFSLHPRFLVDNNNDGFFTNGYGVYPLESSTLAFNTISKHENFDVVQKILNSSLMDYYITKTSVFIEGGYPCYQKNFIERFTIPDLSDMDIEMLRQLSNKEEIDSFLCGIYGITLKLE